MASRDGTPRAARRVRPSSWPTTSVSRSVWARAAAPSSRTTSEFPAAAIISSSRIDSAVSGVRSWWEASAAKSRSADSRSVMRRAEPSSPSASRSSSATPYRRPSGRASPRPSRSAALASSSSGRVSRRACRMASATATATAASASAPISARAPVSRPYSTELSAATVTRKSLVTACLTMALPAWGRSPTVNSGCSSSRTLM